MIILLCVIVVIVLIASLLLGGDAFLSSKAFEVNFVIIRNLEKKYKTKLTEYEINTPLRRAHFWSQLAHESGLRPIQENLNYSVYGLLSVFPKYFTHVNVMEYANKPEKIANKVYGGRMGNTEPSDGWKYRGRGYIQMTGKDTYKRLSDAVGVDYVSDPDKLLNDPDAIVAALWFWKDRKINKLADIDDVVGVTKKINGGLIGLADRKKKLQILKDWI